MRYFGVILSFLLFQVFGFSQTGSVRGFVYEKDNGEPVIFTNVFLKGTTFGASSDVNGYFSISKVKPGKYSLMVTYLGYDTLVVPIEVSTGEILTKNLYLAKSSITLEGVTVSADRQEMKTDVRTSLVKITAREMHQLPSIGSDPDLAQYLQVVPGVVFTGDQGGQLYIRGGSPIQNKVLLDGMVIYNPFHSIGLFSVFDSDIIRNSDVYTGGFSAEYGGRVSSVMDITTRDGNKKRLSGKLSTSTFGSKILLEGPLKKYSPESSTSTTFILSAKTSYLEQSSKLFYKYINEEGLPFNFTDLYGKVSLSGVNGTKINLYGFNFTDQVKYQAVSDMNWNSFGLGSNVILVPTGSPVLIKTNMSYSNYEISLKELDDRIRKSLINGFNFGLSFVYFLGTDELNYGFETLGFKTKFDFSNSVGREISQEENTTELSIYVKYKHNFGKLIFEPSFRTHYYASLSELSPEPRLGLKYNVSERFRLKFSGGLYSQNLISANSDRDVVNLFYGFLSGPENLQDEFDGKEVTSRLQKSKHAIFGMEIDITNRIDLTIEGYYKDNTQLTNLNRNKLYEDDGDNYMIPDLLKKDFIVETGNSYGADLLCKYDYKQLYIWFVYSLGYVTRYSEFEDSDNKGEYIYKRYIPHYDRRHNINFVASYKFGKHLNWEASARWNLGSGFPFTKTKGMYEKLPFIDGISSVYQSMNGEMGIVYGELNGGKLPYYHRLDATLKRNFEFKNSTLQANFGITNIYDRKNVFYFDRVKHQRVDQLPFMPSVGLNFTF